MGSIPGPIVSFRWQVGNINQSIDTASKQIKANLNKTGKETAQTFVAEWQKASVQLRASLTTDKLGLSQITKERERIIGLATKEISLIRTKTDLQKQDLTVLRQATLEIERQKSALSGTGGVTTGTRSVIQQLLGGINARAGSYGGGAAGFAGLRVTEPLGKFAEEASGAHLALLGVGTAAVAAGAALVMMAVKGAHFAVEMENVAQKAHISIQSTIELRSAAEALGVEFDPIIGGFRKFNKEITLAMGASLPHASIEAKRAAEIFSILGVDVKKAALDPMEGIRQLSAGLSRVQEGAVKGAVETELFGRGAQALAPVLNKLGGALDDTKKSSDALASKITDAAKAGRVLDTQIVNLDNQWHLLSVTIGSTVIPVITKIISFLNWVDAYGSRNSGKPFFGGAAGGPTLGSMNSVLGGVSKNFAPIGSESAKLAAAMSQDSTGRGGKKGAYEGESLHSLLTKDIEEFKKYQKEKQDARKKELDDWIRSDERELQSSEKAAKGAAEAWKKELSARIAGDLKAVTALDKLHAQWLDSVTDAATKIKNEYAQQVDRFQQMNDKQLISAQQFNEARAELGAIANKKLAALDEQRLSAYKSEAGNIFDAILSGNGKGTGDMIAKELEGIILKPLKDAFSNAMATMFQGLSGNVNSAAGSGPVKGISGGLGKIFGGITSFLGLGGSNAIQLQTQNVTAGVVNVNGAGVGTGTGPLSGQGNIGGIPGIITNLTSTSAAGIGGISFALAAAGGTAVAGAGGAAVASGGTAVAAGSGLGSIGALPTTMPGMPGASSGLSIGHLIGAALPGLAVMGQGLHDSNGVATALGVASAGSAVLGTIAKSLGGNNSSAGKLLGGAGTVVGGVGSIIAGSQKGGVGGVLMGVEGGAQIGALAGPIGMAIGAVVGGMVSGIFGGGSAAQHAQHWQTAVTHAQALQQIIAPPSESFNFAAGNNMSSTFANTFSQGPGGTFGTAALPGNTPFSASSIIGYPKTGGELTALQLALSRVNTGLPFFGAPTTGLGSQGIFQGQNLQPGTHSSGTTEVHFHLPGFIDKNSGQAFIESVAPQIHALVGKAVSNSSTGMRTAMLRGTQMP
jgi:hypothetical protein